MALRIVWRNNEEQIWQNIQELRKMYDDMIKQFSNDMEMVYFVSATTGVISPQKRTAARIYPAVSYWIVLKRHLSTVEAYTMLRSLKERLPSWENSEVKLLQEPPIISTADKQHNVLCTVIKDHNGHYVKRRLTESKPNAFESNYSMATRLVTCSHGDVNVLKQMQQELTATGIYLDVMP
jgi:hypothetical protein